MSHAFEETDGQWYAAVETNALLAEYAAREKRLRELCFNLRSGCAYQTDKDYHIAAKIEDIFNEGEKP